MLKNLVLTIISDDRPGVVEKLANIIHAQDGNWLESHLSQLAGKFAGILRVSIPDENLVTFQAAAGELQQQGIKVLMESIEAEPEGQSATTSDESATPATHELMLNLVGNDRPGIVHEVSRALASTQVNVLELKTRCTSTPWSGEPLFEADGLIAVPISMNTTDVELLLEPIAGALGLEISLEPNY